MSSRRILVTSALPYANGHIHIGHLVEYLQTDMWVRFQKLIGRRCLYVCADDTHGTAIMIRARQEGVSEEQVIAEMQQAHQRDFAGFGIEFDNYGSTNSPETREACNEIWNEVRKAGLVEEREVTQLYDAQAGTVTAMLAAGSKKMGFVALFKVLLIGLFAIKSNWDVLIGIVAIVTMTVGNLSAIQQTNIKRMLAYSSIAQAGYILIAIPVGTEYALSAGIMQIMTHAFMKGGAFLIVATLSTVAVGESISNYKGLAKRAPFMAFGMTVLLFSLAGIPPLAGFFSKFVLFSAPIQESAVAGNEWMLWLAVAAIINSAISLYYYVRVVKYMYVDEPEEGTSTERLKLPVSMVAATGGMVACSSGGRNFFAIQRKR